MNKKISIVINIALLLMVAYMLYTKFFRKPNFEETELAPNFVIESPYLKENTDLSSFRGQYVLLDFWGSWCGPCRQANQWLVPIYHKYNQKGFEIISIGVERERDYEKWQNAIRHDQLDWPYHINDSKRFSGELVKLYGVKEIPTHFLLNPEGVIVGVDLNEKELEDWLQKALGQIEE